MNLSSRIAWTSAFFLAVALFYAPLAYGCARPDMLPSLYALLIVAIATGVISFMIDGSWPVIPKYVAFCVGALLVQGWWMTLMPVFPSIVAANGGVLNTTMAEINRLSFASMLLTTIMLGAFYVTCGLFSHQVIRRFLLLSVAGSGVLICLIGVYLKTAGAWLMQYIWKPHDIYWNDFALFRYHGNAGAFLNLVWPLILVFTRRAYTPTGGMIKKIIWTVASLTCGLALFLNASKSAMIIGLLILPWPFMTRLLRLRRDAQALLAGFVLILVTGAMLGSGYFAADVAFERLTNGHEVSDSFDGRMNSYRDDMNGLPAAGLFGYGPGMFQVAYPYQFSPMRNVGEPMRNYAHEDYLQTVLEWGWLGTLGWSLIVFGGLHCGVRTYQQRSYFTSKTERHLVLAAILGVGATLAQSLVDFPLQIASLRLFFLVLLALCWASPQFLTIPPRNPDRKRFRLAMPAEYASEAS